MELPQADTPLYNHTLPLIEYWLTTQGCKQDKENLHCWYVEKSDWKAEICLETEELTVRYLLEEEPNREINRAFKYSLSRDDVESAVFSGP